MRFALSAVDHSIKLVKQRGLQYSVSEGNSFYNGGAVGISNTYAAALWTADYAFETSKAGVESVQLHWGDGGRPGTCNNGVYGGGYGFPPYGARHIEQSWRNHQG